MRSECGSRCRRRRRRSGARFRVPSCRLRPSNQGRNVMYEFTYHRPASVADAAALLAANADAKLLAGGQTYLPTLKQRLAQPTDLIDLGRITELKGIKEEGGGLTIGAMARHADVAHSDVVKRVIPSLAALAELIGDPQVRNRGTIGGSISNNDPAADYPGALLALNAVVRTNKRE